VCLRRCVCVEYGNGVLSTRLGTRGQLIPVNLAVLLLYFLGHDKDTIRELMTR